MPARRSIDIVEHFRVFPDRGLQPFRNAICHVDGRDAGNLDNDREALIRLLPEMCVEV